MSGPAAPSSAHLERLREDFLLPPDRLYFNGNSLGPLSRRVQARIDEVVTQEWGQDLVASWNQAGWVDLPLRLGDKIGRLLGAAPGQTLACDSTSINVYKLMGAALDRTPERREVLIEQDAFPTDHYMAAALARQHPRIQLRTVSGGEMYEAIGPHTAAALLNHVHYRSGARLDMAAIQARALNHGVPVVWDLAHSAGALPLQLDACGVEYALGCGYKFLNGGPGAPSFVYVSQACQDRIDPLLPGWFGHARPFVFEPDYAPADGIARLQVGTPPIIGMSALDSAVDMLLEAGIEALWAQACALFDALMAGIRRRPALSAFDILTPAEPERRGSQLSLGHPQAWAICRALEEAGVITDYREPGILRLGLAPLYLRQSDIDTLLERLDTIMIEQRWREPRFQARRAVT